MLKHPYTEVPVGYMHEYEMLALVRVRCRFVAYATQPIVDDKCCLKLSQ